MKVEKLMLEMLVEATKNPRKFIEKKAALIQEILPTVNWKKEVTTAELNLLIKELNREAPELLGLVILGVEIAQAKIDAAQTVH